MPRRRSDQPELMRALVGDGGWVVIEGVVERVVVRVELDDTNRYRVHELHLLDSGQPITGERLRAVRVAALEQLLNLPEERAEIAKGFARRPSVDVEAAVAKFREVVAPASGVTPGLLGTRYDKRGTGVAGMTASGAAARGVRALPQRGYPDDHYAQVADAYRRAFRRGESGHRKPVEIIAAEFGVPRTTAARWVGEARRRGFLPPAQPGKAG
jgi:hypothetical protein